MHPPVILLCAREPARDAWLRALDAIDPPCSAVALSDEADLLTFGGRENIAAVVADRDHGPTALDPVLPQLRDAFANAKLVLSLGHATSEALDACRAHGVDACVPRHYDDRQRRLALEMALAGASPYPGRPIPVEARSAHMTIPPPSAGAHGGRGYDDTYGLTNREKAVAVGLARAQTNHEIALALGLAPGVVRNHVTLVLEKLQVAHRNQAGRILLRLRWVQECIERDGLEGRGVLDRLTAHAKHVGFRKGTVIFRKGEPGKHMYYIEHGSVGLDEIDAEMGPGEIFGDIGAFAPRHLRTCTARARTDVHLLRLDAEHVRRAFFESPEFAFFVVSVIAERVAEERGL